MRALRKRSAPCRSPARSRSASARRPSPRGQRRRGHQQDRTKVHAYIQDSDVHAAGDIEVHAVSDSFVDKAQAIGVAIAAALAPSGAAISIAASIVNNTIANDVQAYLKSASAETIEAGGDISVSADAERARIEDVTAVTVSVSGGFFSFSGGGVGLYGTIDNAVSAKIEGPLTVSALGDVDVLANETASVAADATNVAVSISLGAALGVAIVRNRVDSDITASVAGTSNTSRATVNSSNTRVRATSTAEIPKTTSVGVSAALVGGAGNESSATVATLVSATTTNATFDSSGDVTIASSAHNSAESEADGGAFGAIAVGAMVANVRLGRDTFVFPSTVVPVDEIVAAVGDNTTISAGALSVTAMSNDDVLAKSVAAGGGVVAAAGAQSTVTIDTSAVARLGDNVSVTVNTLYMNASLDQDFDSSADSYSIAVAAGSGAGATNTLTSKARVDIGGTSVTPTSVLANNIIIAAINDATKDKYSDSSNLRAGSASAANITVLKSQTDFGTASNPFLAQVNIASGAHLVAVGSNSAPGLFQIEVANEITAVDSVRIETVSSFGIGVGQSLLTSHSLAKINVDGATLENRSGDVYLTTRTGTGLRPSANLLVASALTGVAAAEATATTNAENKVDLNNATIKGSDIYVFAGLNAFRVPNLLNSFADAELTAISLYPNLSIPLPTATIHETNQVLLRGTTALRRSRTQTSSRAKASALKVAPTPTAWCSRFRWCPTGCRCPSGGRSPPATRSRSDRAPASKRVSTTRPG
jgi:hypothetical protein